MRRLATVLLAMLLGCAPRMDERIEYARALADDSRFEEMIPLLTTMHYEGPEDPEINHLYGLALLRTQNSGMAVWPLRRAASSPGREVEDGLLLAEALARGSFPFDAIGAIGIACVAWIPNQTLISNWFTRKRGMAMGIHQGGIA